MRVCLLASGSSGNCGVVTTDRTQVLIDAGVPRSGVRAELEAIGADPDDADALLISHEHGDHCREAHRLASHFECPVYASRRTLPKIAWALDGHPDVASFRLGEPFAVGELTVEPFRVFHDAAEPCGFLITGPSGSPRNGQRQATLAYATDLGVVPRALAERLREVDGLVVEANHDLALLIDGPYAWHHKQRIRSPVGHLSNEAAGELIAELVEQGRLQSALLAHLSETNNRPELARETVESRLNGLFRCDVHVAPRHERSPVMAL